MHLGGAKTGGRDGGTALSYMQEAAREDGRRGGTLVPEVQERDNI